MVKCLAVEWVDFARINYVVPGFIATDLLARFPVEWKLLWPDMMTAAVRLCETYELKGVSDMQASIDLNDVLTCTKRTFYMTGTDLVIDAGYTVP